MNKMQALVHGLVALSLFLLPLVAPAASCTVQEEASLLQFLDELSPDSSNKLTGSWRNSTSCCAWEGVTCNSNGTVTDLLLPSRGLEGNISASLFNLTGLLHLNLSDNSLSGGVPLELMSSGSIAVLDVSFNRLSGELQEFPSSRPYHPLKVLNISNNFFWGEFPSTVWDKKRDLVEINASHNTFKGNIPSSFCISSPSSFAVLDLSYNLFSGSIPTKIGECFALRVLKVGDNDISGALPEELFNATLLEHLSFSKNGLEGQLNGRHIVKLRDLKILDLGHNNLIGTIPDSIRQLRRLEELHLDYNNMTGEIPSAVGNCTGLRVINLRGNNLGGEILKVNFSALPNLETLDLMSNNFTGKIPESIYSCSNLTTLQLSSNKFYGKVSPRIGNLKALTFISLANNYFENITNALHILENSRNITTLLLGLNFKGEAMPDNVTIPDSSNLKVLSMGSCLLSGEIPFWLSKLARLEILDLSSNELTGTLPVWIHSLNFLYFIDISNNRLTGDLPTNIMDMPMLQSEKDANQTDPTVFELPADYEWISSQSGIIRTPIAVLNLGNNYLTGAIPSQVSQYKPLKMLNLSFNSLSGDIPQELGNLTNLQVIDLSNNHLTGSIPSALSNLQSLSLLDISNNDLEGAIPSVLEFHTVAAGNPKLCDPMAGHKCTSTEAASAPNVFTEQNTGKIVFAAAFGAFFCLGVLYDQLVLSRFFGHSSFQIQEAYPLNKLFPVVNQV
ncbi:hypothetical protein ACP4OV_028014 [Aristida adscensionis]